MDCNQQHLIKAYFHLGHKYKKIILFLKKRHGIDLKLRQLKYIVNQKLGLHRVTNSNPVILQVIKSIIKKEKEGSVENAGYRAMTDILKKKYGICIARNMVMKLNREVDPVGCVKRRQRRLHRRQYRCPGPNASWHLDGYDKLSPWGFCISGCIDGYSRKIIYLRVGPTNHDPKVIGSYYLQAVKEFGAPRLLYTDCGTENVLIATIQSVFHHNSGILFSGSKSHRFGSSPSNQRIESWWSIFRKGRIEWWISLFKDLTDQGYYQHGNPTHKVCLQYAFMEYIQTELDEITVLWNTHSIAKNKMAECPSGIPDENFYLHEENGVNNFGKLISATELDWATTQTQKASTTSDNNFQQYIDYVMAVHEFSKPTTWKSCLQLYFFLISTVSYN